MITNEKILALIDEYWNIAYQQGVEGRSHDNEAGDAQRVLSEITAALALLPGETRGWQLVPSELTEDMRDALMSIRQEHGSTLRDNADEIYSAFLSWAPKAPASPAPQPVSIQSLPYQTLFNAIAAATMIEGGSVGISVEAFRSALSSPVERGTEKEGLANALEMTGCENEDDLIDMANVGRSLMDKIDNYTKAPSLIENWSPADDPAEIVGDLYNYLEEALSSPSPSAEIDELRRYAHEATKVITGLAGGGSENFSSQIGDMFKADLEFCAKKIRDRHETIHGLVVKAKKENDGLRAEIEALRVENGTLRKALFPFATDADIYDGPAYADEEKLFNDNITIGDLRRVRAALQQQGEGNG